MMSVLKTVVRRSQIREVGKEGNVVSVHAVTQSSMGGRYIAQAEQRFQVRPISAGYCPNRDVGDVVHRTAAVRETCQVGWGGQCSQWVWGHGGSYICIQPQGLICGTTRNVSDSWNTRQEHSDQVAATGFPAHRPLDHHRG